MKIYLSAGFDQRERMRDYRDLLWKAGHDVVSSWLDEVPKPEGMEEDAFFRKLGTKDMAELFSASLVIIDFIAPSTSGGRDVEFGIALARHQRCQLWMVGFPARRCPFHELADRRFTDWKAALDALGCPSPEGHSPVPGPVNVLPTSVCGSSRTIEDWERSAQPWARDALGQGEIDGPF